MEYMSNSIIKYDNYETIIDGVKYLHKDYTSKNFRNFYSFGNRQSSDFFKYIMAENNTTFEKISYDVYGSTKYWDVIMLLNNRDALFGLPTDYDTLSDIAMNKANKYSSSIRNISEDRKNGLFEKYLSDIIEENEKKRNIKLVLPERISEFLKLARTEGVI